ncbi:MAG TPA: amidohydrolase [Chloroflexota bacterium]|nr:amidohydrolase [Chloroflexota bacterium]
MKVCDTHTPEQTIASHFQEAVRWRRDLHRHPQPAWLEFYSTGMVAEKLAGWGYRLQLGREIVAPERQLLLPAPKVLEVEYRRAIEAGIQEQFVAPARGGFTGVVATLDGPEPGPTVAFRFDIDSNEVMESADPSHRPAREGFASQYPGYAHACGHDAHTAIGLLLARHFAENRDRIRGSVKFIFQPNEENLSGALAMVDMGLLDGVDYLFGAHVGLNVTETGLVGVDVRDFLALARFEVTYTGRATHAAARPDEGKNALLGACAAVTNLYAISRHGLGASRVNIGTFEAGTTWNVIPDRATFRMETRGATDEINAFMARRARDVLEGAARMYDLGLEVKPAATALSRQSSPDMVELASSVAGTLPSVKGIAREIPFNASEDVTVMMERVQKRGGKALFLLLGTPTFGGHHSTTFDIDETVIRNGAELFAALYERVTG